MNIFILDTTPAKAARLHADRHVVKMILESAQMLSTVRHANGLDAPYRPTHKNHPCTLWVGASRQNYSWLSNLMLELNDEWRYRYRHTRNHKSMDAMLPYLGYYSFLPDIGLTPFVECMPEEYKRSYPLFSYRNYYANAKAHLHHWTRRPTPSFIQEYKI